MTDNINLSEEFGSKEKFFGYIDLFKRMESLIDFEKIQKEATESSTKVMNHEDMKLLMSVVFSLNKIAKKHKENSFKVLSYVFVELSKIIDNIQNKNDIITDANFLTCMSFIFDIFVNLLIIFKNNDGELGQYLKDEIIGDK